MAFNKRQIVEFKSKKGSYVTWRTNLNQVRIKNYFYNSDVTRSINAIFPDKDLQYFPCCTEDIVIGNYKLGIKYINKNESYYMFLSANSFILLNQTS